MAAAVGLKSKSGVSRLVKGLEERGAIKRLPHLHGAIELVPGFAREIDVDGEKATVWFEMRKHPDRFGLVRIIEFPEGLQVWVGGELRWKSYA
jgi:SOS-response transcriptional repressor LexA